MEFLNSMDLGKDWPPLPLMDGSDVDTLCVVLQFPTPGPTDGSVSKQERATLVGPMITPKGMSLQMRNNIKYPCYRIRDTQSLKDK